MQQHIRMEEDRGSVNIEENIKLNESRTRLKTERISFFPIKKPDEKCCIILRTSFCILQLFMLSIIIGDSWMLYSVKVSFDNAKLDYRRSLPNTLCMAFIYPVQGIYALNMSQKVIYFLYFTFMARLFHNLLFSHKSEYRLFFEQKNPLLKTTFQQGKSIKLKNKNYCTLFLKACNPLSRYLVNDTGS